MSHVAKEEQKGAMRQAKTGHVSEDYRSYTNFDVPISASSDNFRLI
jgi:hypothetical protein